MSSRPPSPRTWEGLLTDQDVVVLNKATFFTTIKLLFHYAEDPQRRTWEFFHYRGWGYILGTWCATFSSMGFAASCGAQHPFIHRLLLGMHYALPDYVLLSHSQDADGEQEDRLLLVVEIKALGIVDPDTLGGRQTAEAIFQRTFQQRQNQARLAFRSHPSQDVVHIVMAAGPWFAPYTFKRSDVLPDDKLGDEASSHSPPIRKRRRNRKGALPSKVHEKRDAGSLEGNGDEERSTVIQDGGKRKRGANPSPKTAAPRPVVNHVFKLGPSGERNALNPWFLQVLERVKKDLAGSQAEFKTQNSWFDLHEAPAGDGHAEGFVLPTTAEPVPEVEDIDIGHVVRLDEDPALISEPSTPGNTTGSESLNMMQLNAMLSPAIRRITPAPRGGSGGTPSIFGALPTRAQDAQSTDSASATDDDITPKDHRGRHSQGLSSQRSTRELSPSEAYVGRRQGGPLHPPELHAMPSDLSPPHFTPHKRLFSRHTPGDENESESFTSPDAIPRPASSPPSYAPYVPTDQGLSSRGTQSLLSDRAPQVQMDPSAPSTSFAVPIHPIQSSHAVKPPRKVQYVLAPPMRRAPSRAMLGQLGDPTPLNEPRLKATEREWNLKLPFRDELHCIVWEAAKVGHERDHEQAFRKAGMSKSLARNAAMWFKNYLEKSLVAAGGKPVASAAPPPHSQQRRGTHPNRVGPYHGGQLPRSGATMGPPPTPRGDGAHRSHPPQASGSGARSTGSAADRRDKSHSESSSSNDCSDDASSPAAVGPAHEAEMNRLTKGIGNIDVANAPQQGGAGSAQRGYARPASPGPSNAAQPFEENSSPQVDADSILPESNPEPGQSSTDARRKGKEKQR